MQYLISESVTQSRYAGAIDHMSSMLVRPMGPCTWQRCTQRAHLVGVRHGIISVVRQPLGTCSVPLLIPAATSNEVQQPVDADAALTEELQLPSPKTRFQQQLTGKERAAHRAHTEGLAKEKKLQRLQVGAQGITFNVLMACMDVLMKHEYLRVKLGEGCGLERKHTATVLAALLDAVVVFQVGFTITLYRKKGLPRPDNLLKSCSESSL